MKFRYGGTLMPVLFQSLFKGLDSERRDREAVEEVSSKLEQIMGIQSSTDYSRDNSLQIWVWD